MSELYSLVVFSKEGCSHCHDAMAFIDEQVKKQYPDLPILIWDVERDDNLAKLLAVAKSYRIPNDRLGTPVLLYNGQILIGWQPRYEKKLLGMIKSAQKTSQNK